MSTVYRLAPIYTRVQFGDLLNDMGLTGGGAEIGTHRGKFATVLLDRWKGKLLYCIDPWSIPEGYEEQAPLLPERGASREDDFNAAVAELRPHISRVCFFKLTSEKASVHHADGSLDFVYLDGDHRREEFSRDVGLWWPKVSPGGVLAGHDWLSPGEEGRPGEWSRNIQPVVHDLAVREGVPVYLVPDPDNHPWSFYVVKPK